MKTGQAEKAERQSSFAPSSAPVSETREYVSSHSAVRNETSTKELSVPPMERSNERRQYVESAPYPTFDFSNDEQIRQSLEQARARMERLRPYNTLRDQYEKGRQKGQQRTQYNKARHEVIQLRREQNRRTRTKGRIDKQ